MPKKDHPTEACAEHSGKVFLGMDLVSNNLTKMGARRTNVRQGPATPLAYHRPRYPLPSQHLCRARLRFSRQLQSNIHYHLRQINHWILEPCLQNLQRTLPSDEPQKSEIAY
ncbi:hypothetical protein CA85_43150 [Allorhodopirellula solitaria]|uniref:Uncharacterized protein n=1 Tax=Allorhodopirellula solitaria TaxID=2527987 RepID=A0A5C5X251_9BACT|nr:hypothetical protein CA85_43150 [Allorhodopirellula solitaria]